MAHISETTEARIYTGSDWRLRLEAVTTGSTASITTMTTASTIDFRDPDGTTGALGPITLDSTRFVYYDITSETTIAGDWHFYTHIIVAAGSTFIGNPLRMQIFRPGFLQ